MSEYGYQECISELIRYRTTYVMLIIHDWIRIPLVYTQVQIIELPG